MAYLPLAHIMEMAAETVMLALGAAIGYGSPQTLTDTGLKLAPGTRGDAPTLKPTFMVFAPAVLDRVRQAVQAKFSAAKPALKKTHQRGLGRRVVKTLKTVKSARRSCTTPSSLKRCKSSSVDACVS